MELATKNILLSTINCFETGKPQGDYSNISVYQDGTLETGRKFWQVTYGRSQTTESGKLKKLLEMYIANNGQYAVQLAEFMPSINKKQNNGVVIQTIWTLNKKVLELLKKMGEDPIMRSTQDAFFDAEYFDPAMQWAEENDFIFPFSKLVIYDSFIHSGKILDFLREKFEELPPAKGGSEMVWVIQYLYARYRWLQGHRNPILRKTANRVWQLILLSKSDNWLLTKPFKANGEWIIRPIT